MVNSSGVQNTGLEIGTKRNSSQLQKIFHSVYKDFFNTHDIILSGSSILTWGPDISHGIGTVGIKQKLPTKTFCGANLNNSGRVTFGSLLEYSTLDNSFRERDLDRHFSSNRENVIGFLENFLTKNGFTQGIKIDILSETPPGHGFAFSGVSSVLTTFLLYIIIGKLDPKILIYQEIDSHVLLFDELYKLSLELSSCISGGKSVGATNYAVMIPNHTFPIVHFSNKPTGESSCGENIMNEENTGIRLDLRVDDYRYIIQKKAGDNYRNFSGVRTRSLEWDPSFLYRMNFLLWIFEQHFIYCQ